MMVAAKQITALIDLGSNSARLLIVESEPEAGYTVLRQVKSMIRLGDGAFVYKNLTPQSMERALIALDGFMKIIRAFKVDRVQAVATAAVREALNQKAFLAQVFRRTGLRVRVVSGLEEARLIYLGVSRHLALNDRPALFMDIGGGSTEIIVGNKAGHLFLDSLPLGAVRLTGAFNPGADNGLVDPRTYRELRAYVTRHCLRAAGAIKAGPPLSAVYGSSGTIENLAAVQALRVARPGEAPEVARPISVAELSDLAGWLGGMTQDERRRVKGLNPQRADVIMAGCAILEGLLRAFGVDGVTPVNRGLQEGLLVDWLDRSDRRGNKNLSIREASISNLGRRCNYDSEHAQAVADVAGRILRALTGAGLLRAGARAAELLRLAALVHDVGKFISYERHHHHSWYLIKNAELLGFDQDEIHLMAFLALSHRKKKKKEIWPPETRQVLDNEPNALALGFILRFAESLEFGRRGLISEVEVKVKGREAHFLIKGPPLGDVLLDERNLRQMAKDFQKGFGLNLRVKVI